MAMGIYLMEKPQWLLEHILMFLPLTHRILEKGTAYQTDFGMCGDYNSVIGMDKENSLKKFLKDP